MEKVENKEQKVEKFSYSKLEVYNQCSYKYKLVYVDKHFINQPSIATDFGTLIHYIEETMANTIKAGKQINYRDMINILYGGAFIEEKSKKNNKNSTDNEKIEKIEIKGITKLKEEYPTEYITPDKNGRTYADKVEDYIDSGICRLEDYLATNPDLEIYSAEEPFELDYRGYVFHGFIDRIFRNKVTGEYIIEDIKTYGAPLEEKKLITPLQFVIYTKAFSEKVKSDNIKCAYELPLCNIKQQAGTKGFVDRGMKTINKLLDAIEHKEFEPNPTPLCHWCVFSKTYPNQPEEAKNLCPYFSHWTAENRKDFSVENPWMGEENHLAILEAFINDYKTDKVALPEIKVERDNSRKFLIRR